MKLFVIAGYMLVAIVVYSVLMKVLQKHGKSSPNAEKIVIALALIWPLWGEFAIIAIAGYVLFKGWAALKTT